MTLQFLVRSEVGIDLNRKFLCENSCNEFYEHGEITQICSSCFTKVLKFNYNPQFFVVSCLPPRRIYLLFVSATLARILCFQQLDFVNDKVMARDYDYLLKILLVGDSDVGKHEILSGLDDASSERPFCGNSLNSSKFILAC